MSTKTTADQAAAASGKSAQEYLKEMEKGTKGYTVENFPNPK